MKIKKLLILIFFLSILNIYQTSIGAETTGYQPLAPLDGLTSGSTVSVSTSGDTSGTGLSEYIEGLYKWGIGLTSGLAVLVIMWGGVGYMTSAGGSGVEEAKGRISAALMGLLLALGSYIILKTINKDLLKTTFELSELTVTSTTNSSSGSSSSSSSSSSSGSAASTATTNTTTTNTGTQTTTSTTGTTNTTTSSGTTSGTSGSTSSSEPALPVSSGTTGTSAGGTTSGTPADTVDTSNSDIPYSGTGSYEGILPPADNNIVH